jgi:hypothetical protein
MNIFVCFIGLVIIVIVSIIHFLMYKNKYTVKVYTPDGETFHRPLDYVLDYGVLVFMSGVGWIVICDLYVYMR